MFSCRHAEYLVKTDSDDSLPYCIAAGNVPLAIQYLTNRGQHLDAMLVAAAANEGHINGLPDALNKELRSEQQFRKNHHDTDNRCISVTKYDFTRKYYFSMSQYNYV